jgi:hypothetical protein
VVQWLVTGTCNSAHAMPLLCLISMMAASLQFSFTSVWIPLKKNDLSDAASHFQYSRLFKLVPHLPQMCSSTQSHLTGIKCTLTSLHMLHSIFSMELHPALAKPIPLPSASTLTLSALAPAFASYQVSTFW